MGSKKKKEKLSIKKDRINVYNMTCTSCENRIEKAIKKLNGVIEAKASYSEQYVDIEYDSKFCDSTAFKGVIKKTGYSTEPPKDYKFIGILIVVAAIVLLGMKATGIDMDAKLENASYGVLFVIGVLTSLHCVGMCGGIMISQSITKDGTSKFSAMLPAILYNVGRVVSYTILGGIVGALGSVVALSLTAKAFMQIFAGVFMIMMGFNMAGFKAFRKFQLHIKLPSFCRTKNKGGSPFIVGILNGLMPCGPLQTMQLYALGTGSAFNGAMSMFLFAVGTVPLMLAFGAISGILAKGYTQKILKTSGVLIIVLGVIMGNRGFALAGINLNPLTILASNKVASGGGGGGAVAKATIENGVQTVKMTANTNGFVPNALYVQKGIPIKWVINGEALNSCNNAIVIPSLNKEIKLKKGENVIDLPASDKDINFSCWMGMIPGVIKVVDNLDAVDTSVRDASLPPESNGPSCCALHGNEGVGEDSSVQTNTDGSNTNSNVSSIYGDDISKVSTDLLIHKAVDKGQYLDKKLVGIGNELQPLVVVTGFNKPTKLSFDLTAFDSTQGALELIEAVSGVEVAHMEITKDLNTIDINPKKAGTYGIIKDGNVLGILEVVDNVQAADLEQIRAKYLK